jgi:Flp pilus assembly protein TadG
MNRSPLRPSNHRNGGVRRDARCGGIASLWMVMAVMVLFAFFAMAIDILYVTAVAQQLQTGADAAALSAVRTVKNDQASARGDASAIALLNSAGSDPIQVRLNSGNGANGDIVVGIYDRSDQSFTPDDSSPNAVKVRALRTAGSLGGQLPLLFGSVIGINTVDVAREAIAMVVSEPAGLGIIMLQPNGPDALQHSGNADITVQGPVYINSTSSKGLQHSGNGDFTASSFQIVGNYQSSGGGDLIGPINTGTDPIPDPLAGLPVPNPNNFTVRSNEPFKVEGTKTLLPGVYNGGIEISTSKTVTMSAGIYLIRGKGFKVSGNPKVVANNVMVYNSDGPDDDVDQFYISGDADVTWTPPTSGPWAGIAIFQQRNVEDKKIEISGNGETNIAGTIYARDGEVQLSGNGGTSFIGGAFVVNKMQISGDGTLNIGDDGSSSGGAGKVFLVK